MQPDRSDQPDAKPRPGRRLARHALSTALAVLIAIAASAVLLALYAVILWLRLPDVGGLGDAGDPGPSAFMAESGCDRIERRYRPLDEIDPRIGCTVVWSEDFRFFEHDGVDMRALHGALRTNWRHGALRYGASTIPMQLARNVALSRSRTPSRKLREILLARRMVERYDRLRILELYLNAAEWAPCVYGVDAAARHYLGHDADVIDPAEATFLAVMLPRPGHPPGFRPGDRQRLIRRQQELLTRLSQAGLMAPRTVAHARAEVFALHRSPGRHTARAGRPASHSWYDHACGTVRQPPGE